MSLLMKVYRKAVCLRRKHTSIAGIFRNGLETLDKIGTMFDLNILNNLSCKQFKATTFEYPPVTTVKVLENGTLL